MYIKLQRFFFNTCGLWDLSVFQKLDIACVALSSIALHCGIINHIYCVVLYCMTSYSGTLYCIAMYCVVMHFSMLHDLVLSGVTLSFGGRCETGWKEGCTKWTGKRVFFLERRHLIENRLIRKFE